VNFGTNRYQLQLEEILFLTAQSEIFLNQDHNAKLDGQDRFTKQHRFTEPIGVYSSGTK